MKSIGISLSILPGYSTNCLCLPPLACKHVAKVERKTLSTIEFKSAEADMRYKYNYGLGVGGTGHSPYVNMAITLALYERQIQRKTGG